MGQREDLELVGLATTAQQRDQFQDTSRTAKQTNANTTGSERLATWARNVPGTCCSALKPPIGFRLQHPVVRGACPEREAADVRCDALAVIKLPRPAKAPFRPSDCRRPNGLALHHERST
jgi:hypothetical protein